MTDSSSGGSAGRRLIDAPPARAPRLLRRGTRLFHEGDPAAEAFYVHRGLVKMVKTARGGTQALVAMRGAGGFVGEHSAIDGLPRLTSAVAVTDTSVTAVPGDQVVQAVRDDSELALELLVQFSAHLRATTRHVLEMTAGDAVALVARRVTQLASDPMFEPIRTARRGDVVIEMPISQHELASWAGVSPRSVAGALRRLRDDGLISTDRLRLEVHDREALAERAVVGMPAPVS